MINITTFSEATQTVEAATVNSFLHGKGIFFLQECSYQSAPNLKIFFILLIKSFAPILKTFCHYLQFLTFLRASKLVEN